MVTPSTYWRPELSRSKGKRHRYIGFRIVGIKEELEKGAVIRAIRDKAREVLGKEARNAGVKLVRFNGKEGAVHCFHLYKEEVIEILRGIDRIGDLDVKIETIGTSGTIKSLNKKFFKGRLGKEFAIY